MDEWLTDGPKEMEKLPDGDSHVARPMSWDEYFMRHVYLAASMSKDPKTKIGAVLVKGETIVSEGYNGFPRGVMDLASRYRDRNLKRLLVEHGEANALSNCSRNGICVVGATMYTQGIPCGNCAGQIIQCGVGEIVIHGKWPNLVHSKEWVESIDRATMMFKEAHVRIRKFNKRLRVTGFLDGKNIQV